jgi:hypothetical protein
MEGILKHHLALDFIFAGKAFVTFLNTRTENRFTYKVSKHKTKNLFYINVLTSPDVYTYVGFVGIDGKFRISPKSRISGDAQSIRVFDYVVTNLRRIVSSESCLPDGTVIPAVTNLPNFVEVYHSGRCGKCGKRLTVPESVLTGFGPDCFRSISDKQMIRDKKLRELLKEVI